MSVVTVGVRCVLAVVALGSLAGAAILVVTLVCASVTFLRRHTARRRGWSDYRTSLYVGRVSHTRFRPVTHSFAYPLFFCCLDLGEAHELFLSSRAALWPLSLLMRFDPSDHLKNGEGSSSSDAPTTNKKMDGTQPPPPPPASKEESAEQFTTRLCRLVSDRTNGKYAPSGETRTILLLTHLAYFGYCFNPVSFYYFLSKDDARLEAVVAEVSNTPWNEMCCYVLHPDSVDMNTVHVDGDRQATNYVFPKTFHVSPFMDLDHDYDWTFHTPTRRDIVVTTSMIQRKVKFFTAHFNIRRDVFTPFGLCWQLLRLPVYCLIIQLWIHLEAFRLFMKGVVFVPHPDASETRASRIIATLMTPLFALTAWLEKNDKVTPSNARKADTVTEDRTSGSSTLSEEKKEH